MTIAPDPHFARFALVLGLLSAVGPVAIDMYMPGLPVIATDLGTDVGAAQLTLGRHARPVARNGVRVNDLAARLLEGRHGNASGQSDVPGQPQRL